METILIAGSSAGGLIIIGIFLYLAVNFLVQEDKGDE